jgi:hypothetical protein
MDIEFFLNKPSFNILTLTLFPRTSASVISKETNFIKVCLQNNFISMNFVQVDNEIKVFKFIFFYPIQYFNFWIRARVSRYRSRD